jgi:magnesium transporter
VIIDKAVYRDGVRSTCEDLSDAVDALRASTTPGFLWIGLKDPTPEEFELVNRELHLHPLAVEDALHGKQRVKVETYDDTVFASLRTLRYLEESSGVETGEILLFIGDHFVVTVRHGELHALTEVRQRLESQPAVLREHGTIAVFHAVLDTIADRYLEIDAELAQDLSEIETDVFGGAHPAHSSTIYRLKREIGEFRRAAQPLMAPLRLLEEDGGPIASPEMRLRFRDVADHVKQVVEHVDSYDHLLTDVLGAHLAQITVQQNSDMRKISAWVAIAALPTLIASLYGMNFEHMPGLTSSWGYPVTMGVIVLVCTALYRAFRKTGWL